MEPREVRRMEQSEKRCGREKYTCSCKALPEHTELAVNRLVEKNLLSFMLVLLINALAVSNETTLLKYRIADFRIMQCM